MMLKLPLGYRYGAVYAGIRKQEADDLALIVPDQPATAAALFTTNVVQAASVQLAREHLKSSGGLVAAILINAGNANCATRNGAKVALAASRAAAKSFGTTAKQILPASTGVIGVEMDPRLIVDALPRVVADLSADNFEKVARAIMTTDTRVKMASEDLTFKGGTVRIAGMAKGSGMIHPNMATMLAFVMTDAAIPARALQGLAKQGSERSFNSLTVDGDTSTNDTLVVLANAASGIKLTAKEQKVFGEVLTWVMESLAEQIAADGEGARKLIVVRATGFQTHEDARNVAQAIAKSPLVKTAVAGSDPNWGRILCAAGYAGVKFDPAEIDIFLQRQLVCKRGLAAEFDEGELKTKLDDGEVRICVTLRGEGKGEARYFTCDLTEGYIQINGSYRT